MPVLRVPRSMWLNLTRRTRRRPLARVRQPLDVPAVAGRMWSMHDTLCCDNRFRTLIVIGEGAR